jgi:DNA-binding MarR family transcriptional regulator
MSAPVLEIEATTTEECPECLAGNLNWLLTQAHYALGTELAAAFDPLGITPRGHSVLAAAMGGEFTQKELAELIGLDKTTMVVTLDELEAAELAKRVASPLDRRARVVQVTPSGRAKVKAANQIVKRVQTNVLESLGDPEAGEALLDALSRLVRTRLAEPAACKGFRRREPRGRAA